MHGLVGVGLLKTGAAVAAVTAAGVGTVGAVVVVQEMRGAQSESPAASPLAEMRPIMAALEAELAALLRDIQPLPEFPNAMYSRSQANAVARSLALEVIANDSALDGATVEGRSFEPDDLQFVSHRFIENATQPETGLPGNAEDFPAGANIWVVTFVSYGWDTPAGPDELTITVAFQDGATTLLESWMNHPDGAVAFPEGARPVGPRVPVQVLDVEGVTWRLLVNTMGPPWGIGFSVSHPVVSETMTGPVEVPPPGSPDEHAFAIQTARIGGSVVTFGALSRSVASVEVETAGGLRYSADAVQPSAETRAPFSTFAVAHAASDPPAVIRALDAAGNVLTETNGDNIAAIN